MQISGRTVKKKGCFALLWKALYSLNVIDISSNYIPEAQLRGEAAS